MALTIWSMIGDQRDNFILDPQRYIVHRSNGTTEEGASGLDTR